ncbi:MAG TPA: hypothetical protein VM165_21165 [Planctomycetaceae bacterium]|nr:hypothetical protein [Planctomycetaceae bacterium]
MQKLERALQSYSELATKWAQTPELGRSHEPGHWLEREACPVVADLLSHRGFETAACWSLRHLDRGSTQPERQCVERVDATLVEWAAALADASVGLPERTGGWDWSTVARDAGIIAKRPWFDLVAGSEYFHPDRGLHLRVGWPEHSAAFPAQGELRIPLGDYVQRSLCARVRYWSEWLARRTAALSLGWIVDRNRASRLVAAHLAATQAARELQAACADPRGLREAATTLIQVYVACTPVPQIDWWPSDVSSRETDAALVRSVIRRRGPTGLEYDPLVLRQIAGALDTIRCWSDQPDQPEDLIDWLRDRTRLVLVDRLPRTVYWEGVPVAEEAWDQAEKPWNLLWTLAGQPEFVVGLHQLMAPDGEAIRSRRHRLGQLLSRAPGLDGLIDAVRGQGYRLQLKPEAIGRLRDDGFSRLMRLGR